MSDVEPPVLQEVLSVSSSQVKLVFNEEIEPYSDSFEPYEVEVDGYSLLVTLTENIKPGHQIMLECRVKDKVGNTTGIETPVWGYNMNMAGLEINEFSTRGEGNNPDRTELYVTKSGSVAGVVLYNGIPDSWDSMVMLDEVDVQKGDYIVIWWTGSLPEDLKETDGVINICAGTDVNLPGYNGVLTLSVSPAQGAEIIDCVVYSNSSSTYDGFGTKLALERARKAQKNGWWPEELKPVDSNNNTATRTMCKKPDSDDWYVCETKGASFGKPNISDEFTI